MVETKTIEQRVCPCDPLPGECSDPCKKFIRSDDHFGDHYDCARCGHWEECHELALPLHPLFQKILEAHSMAPKKRITGRVCAICGGHNGSTQGYTTFLRLNGLLKDRDDPDFTDKAHARCVQRYGAIATERTK